MSGWNRCLLILLRLVIGWHLLFAGIEKFRKDSWTREAYLREAYGPLATTFRQVAGDVVLEQMTVIQPGQLPPALHADWDAYFRRFVKHYQLSEEKQAKAQATLDRQKEITAKWLAGGIKYVKRSPTPGPAYEVERTTPQRLEDYQASMRALRTLQDEKLAEAHRVGLADQVQKVLREIDEARAEAGKLRRELKADLDAQTTQMREALGQLVSEEIIQHGALAATPPNRWREFDRWRDWSQLDRNDALVACGLTAVGGMLVLGLFSRVACILGALFLIGFYLAAPPLPGAPEALRGEGYPFINKNLVEAMALLALATFPTGRWAGLDAIVHYCNPFRTRT